MARTAEGMKALIREKAFLVNSETRLKIVKHGVCSFVFVFVNPGLRAPAGVLFLWSPDPRTLAGPFRGGRLLDRFKSVSGLSLIHISEPTRPY